MSSSTHPFVLPPLATLPSSGTYPPSSYPPPSYFEDNSIAIHPAIIIPAKRTGEIQRLLDGLIFSEPKRKSVYPPEEGLDYTVVEDIKISKNEENEKGSANSKYNPSRERKLVLTRLGGSSVAASTRESASEGRDEDPLFREAMEDAVWQDARVQALLQSVNPSDGGAPCGKLSIRPSYIRLPTTPYVLLTVDEVLRRIMPTTKNEDGEANINGNDDNTSHVINNNNDRNNLCAYNGNPLVEEIPSSFETAGHIAHVNLREEALPYKYLIGKAILDKNRPRIQLVVNKIGSIENEFRTFPMEILAVASENEGGDNCCAGFAETVERLCAGATTGIAPRDTDGDGDGSSQALSPTVQVKIGPQHRSLMQVEVREHGCRFHLDFARVYFNSRLQGEHARLVQLIFQDAMQRQQQQRLKAETKTMTASNTTIGGKCNSTGNEPDSEREYIIVADAMAGVGPFAVPLTSSSSINSSPYRKAKIICHANDLNPTSYEYLQKNAKLNKCHPERLFMYNMDARKFIHKMNEDGVDVDHFIMNLPQLAPEFLDAFRGWRFRNNCHTPATTRGNDAHPTEQDRHHHRRHRPMIHVHCFGEKARTPDDNVRVEWQVQQRCEMALGCPGCFNSMKDGDSTNEFAVRVVRDVGPRKNMLCVSFRLPIEVESFEKLGVPGENNATSNSLANGVDYCAKGESFIAATCDGKRRLSRKADSSLELEAKRNKTNGLDLITSSLK